MNYLEYALMPRAQTLPPGRLSVWLLWRLNEGRAVKNQIPWKRMGPFCKEQNPPTLALFSVGRTASCVFQGQTVPLLFLLLQHPFLEPDKKHTLSSYGVINFREFAFILLHFIFPLGVQRTVRFLLRFRFRHTQNSK